MERNQALIITEKPSRGGGDTSPNQENGRGRARTSNHTMCQAAKFAKPRVGVQETFLTRGIGLDTDQALGSRGLSTLGKSRRAQLTL